MPINVAASVITVLSLYCGIASVFASIRGEYKFAAYWILLAIIMDTLDGTVARLTKSVSDFGKELDSLSDIVAFGVAPAVLIYNAYLFEGQATNSFIGPTGGMVAIIYVIFGALRLARYNVYQAEREGIFVGLPIPAAAGTIASFALFFQYFEWQAAYWALGPVTLGLSFLMVSTVRYPKRDLQIFVLTPRKGFRVLVLAVIGVAAFNYGLEYSPDIVFLPLGLIYVLFGLVNEAIVFVARIRRAEDPTGESPAKESTEATNAR